MLLIEFPLLGISEAHGSRFLFVLEKTHNILDLKKINKQKKPHTQFVGDV